MTIGLQVSTCYERWLSLNYLCEKSLHIVILCPWKFSEIHTWEEKKRTNIHLKSKNFPYWLALYALSKNAGPSYEWIGAGFTNVNISGLKNGAVDLSSNNWAYKVLLPIFFIFSGKFIFKNSIRNYMIIWYNLTIFIYKVWDFFSCWYVLKLRWKCMLLLYSCICRLD